MKEIFKDIIKLDEYTGIRLGLIGLFLAVIGYCIAYFFKYNIGVYIAAIGICSGPIAAIIHFYMNRKAIFPFLFKK